MNWPEKVALIVLGICAVVLLLVCLLRRFSSHGRHRDKKVI